MTIEVVLCKHPGCVDLRDVRYPEDGVLHLSAAEWAGFLTAVKRGDFDALTVPGRALEDPAGDP